MARKDRKTSKLRGSRTHGYGSAQKHRGAGSRGGRGMAGGKKHQWSSVSKNSRGYFGRKGFKRVPCLVGKPVHVNVGYLSDNIVKLTADGSASKAKGAYTIDLDGLGYTKLLGSGLVREKLKIKVAECSSRARQKVEEKGGTVECTGTEEQPPEKEDSPQQQEGETVEGD